MHKQQKFAQKLHKFTRALLVTFRMSATGTGTGTSTAPVTILDTGVRAGGYGSQLQGGVKTVARQVQYTWQVSC